MEEFIASTLRSATPLALAACGALFAVRAGIFHLGIEGLMLASAFTAVAVAHETSSVVLAVGAALIVSAVLSLLYWGLMEFVKTDSVITGLGLTTLSLGGTAFLLDALFDQRGRLDSPVGLPRPVQGADAGLGAFVTELSILGWSTPILVAVTWLVMRRTGFGLRLVAVGTYPYGARAADVSEASVRLGAMLAASIGASLAGVELALGGLSGFSEGMTAGRGYIALAAVLLGLMRPVGVAGAALFFGSTAAIGVVTQIHSADLLPRPFILMIPFVVTIVAVTVSASVQQRANRPV
ncbi:MAG: ABC transporter permease [Actinomycetota bacterium]